MIWGVVVLAAVAAGWLLGHGDAAGNFRRAAEAAPLLFLTALLGAPLGLYGRDRVRLRRSYASPTRSYAGKLLFFAALSAGAALSFSPLAGPEEGLLASAAAAALGAAVWLGNLPPRL